MWGEGKITNVEHHDSFNEAIKYIDAVKEVALLSNCRFDYRLGFTKHFTIVTEVLFISNGAQQLQRGE